jgi:multidrug efflux pump subunit AcrB
MNPAEFTLKNRTFVTVITLLLILGGILSYNKLGRLENPEFVIKTAMVVTRYPGASAKEVEDEVTDVLEESIQTMGQVKEIISTSQSETSVIKVEMKDSYKPDEIPQIWDELRRKVNDVQSSLPMGAFPSIVNDSFGDVYGVYFALTGEGLTYKELTNYADTIKVELLGCDDVSKVDFWGVKKETIYIEIQRSKMAQLGVSPQQISGLLASQNALYSGGRIEIDGKYLRISPSGSFKHEDQISDLRIGGKDGLIRLGDIAKVTRSFEEPVRNVMRFNGKQAIGIGISTSKGGNCIVMGKSVEKKLHELKKILPSSVKLNTIYYQSKVVTKAVDQFVNNLVQSVAIVIILLVLFMGFQSGLLIGGILLLNILATFIIMYLSGIALQKMSLGALILALGMLVDNAIVVSDGILIRVKKGEDREAAAIEVVKECFWPLFGATLISVLAFAGVGYAPGNVGEFTRDLFNVMAISLAFSWILALTVTPLFCVWFLKVKKLKDGVDPFDGIFYRFYRLILHYSLRYRVITFIGIIVLLGVSLHQAKKIPQSMFEKSSQPYFFVNYWKPQGTHINSTAKDLDQIEKFIREQIGVKQVISHIGEGGMRFYLSYVYQSPNSSFGELLVKVENDQTAKDCMPIVEKYIKKNFPGSMVKLSRMNVGPPVDYPIEVEFRGRDENVLRELAHQAEEIIRESGTARTIHNDWRQLVPVVKPMFSDVQARIAGISRAELAKTLNYNFSGMHAGFYREDNDLIPIVFRGRADERRTLSDMESLPIYSSVARKAISLSQIVTEIKTVWESGIIKRKDRMKNIVVKCEPVAGLPDFVQQKIATELKRIKLPDGYTMVWGGVFEQANEAREPLQIAMPLCFMAMFVVLLWLFNSIRNPVIIFATVPLSLIGVVTGMLLTNKSLEFMAIIGFLGLSGMIIKNSLVLIDQVELELTAGKPPYKAILDSSVSRLRPVTMAAGTTILGMMPLLTDSLYGSMSVTIMSGLFIATFLTLLIVPVMYSFLFFIKPDIKYL